MYHMMTNLPPANIYRFNAPHVAVNVAVPIPALHTSYSHELRDIVMSLLQHNPTHRLSVIDACNRLSALADGICIVCQHRHTPTLTVAVPVPTPTPTPTTATATTVATAAVTITVAPKKSC
jgi:hypothetical protein